VNFRFTTEEEISVLGGLMPRIEKSNIKKKKEILDVY